MKSTLLTIMATMVASGAYAADMPLKAPPMAPSITWTGSYIGLIGGGEWDRARFVEGTDVAVPSASNTPLSGTANFAGGAFGIVDGYNFQLGQWVLGYEGDYELTIARGTSGDVAPFNPVFSQNANLRDLSTFRGRLGYLFAPNWLLYGTGGVALGRLEESVSVQAGNIAETHEVWGWTAGAGIEWMFTQNLSLTFDYLHVGFSNKSYFDPAPVMTGGPTFLNDQQMKVSEDIIRAAIKMKVDWLAILTR
jgi:outer membrane immunogenic protein